VRDVSGGRMIITLLKGSQALPVCPLDKDGMRYIPMNVNMHSLKLCI
jgi:hypothetical protein